MFGGIERHRKQGAFFVVVENRDTATLLPIIKKHIVPGSIIMSEENGYQHFNVNHSKNFKDPATGTDANTIEGSWLHAKRFIYGWRKELMTSC